MTYVHNNKITTSRENWYRVLIPSNLYRKDSEKVSFDEIYKWLYDNLDPHTFYWSITRGSGTYYIFENQEDAALFKITWL